MGARGDTVASWECAQPGTSVSQAFWKYGAGAAISEFEALAQLADLDFSSDDPAPGAHLVVVAPNTPAPARASEARRKPILDQFLRWLVAIALIYELLRRRLAG